MNLLQENPAWKRRVLMLRLDQPSVTILRGRSRWHVLMKLLVHPDTEAMVGAMTALCRARQEQDGMGDLTVAFDYNPVNMM